MKKRGFVLGESLAWWILSIAVAVGVLIFFFVLKGKGIGAIDFFRDLVRFGR